MIITCKWQSVDGEWRDFDISTILYMTIGHAVNLFSGKLPVICKQGEQYYVNSQGLLDSYKRQGKAVTLFSDVPAERLAHKLCYGGFEE